MVNCNLLTNSIFPMVDPGGQRGIGMTGVLAQAHYDSSRTFIVLIKGSCRYILAHPKECEHLELNIHLSIPVEDTRLWTGPTIPSRSIPCLSVQINEVVLQTGDALYLRTHRFHLFRHWIQIIRYTRVHMLRNVV